MPAEAAEQPEVVLPPSPAPIYQLIARLWIHSFLLLNQKIDIKPDNQRTVLYLYILYHSLKPKENASVNTNAIITQIVQ